jgi:hypothetical protein
LITSCRNALATVGDKAFHMGEWTLRIFFGFGLSHRKFRTCRAGSNDSDLPLPNVSLRRWTERKNVPYELWLDDSDLQG